MRMKEVGIFPDTCMPVVGHVMIADFESIIDLLFSFDFDSRILHTLFFSA